jgi:SAM-dependent MidA family methyltransferase
MPPLEALIREMIAAEGPLRLDRYMALVLGHPQHGYYMRRDPFGAEGDFLTAPEISQVFGELIGVWCAAAWRGLGSPAAFHLVELGPGRGTLMADLLRAARVVPEFGAAATVHFVEMSPVLRAAQQRQVPQGRHHATLDTLPDGPFILVANEFFDALPIRQFEKRQGRWFERVIGLDGDALTIGLAPAPTFSSPVVAAEGEIVEVSEARTAVARQIGERLLRQPGAGLIIDYGHDRSAAGDTLQALRRHAFVAVTAAPGACDVTSHVDFEALAGAVKAGGARAAALMSQGQFLEAMGLAARFARLAAAADAATRAQLGRAKARLADRDQMGNLFKVLACHSPGLEVPYPFHPA